MKPSDASEQTIFDAARQMTDLQGRAAYLDEACRGDSPLRERLVKLLSAHERADRFLGGDPLELGECARQTLLVSPLTEVPGTIIGNYKLLEKLGEGGFGVVYMAEQKQPIKRRVALKIIKVGMDTREVVARFEAERQALALMDHPNIAKVFDARATETTVVGQASRLSKAGRRGRETNVEGETPSETGETPAPLPLPAGRPYFVMELVRGIKITDYCDEKHLSTRERLDLFRQVCQAVQHAHQKGIIHRDLKPSNILVTVNDGVAVPKIIDFGIAKATQMELTEKTVFTRFHQFLGTPAYMSPEQAEITSVDIDTRSDIYSLGVLLYELLTGKTPFDTNELLKAGLDAMRRTIREKEPDRPSTRVSTLNGEELTTTAKRRGLEAPKLVNLLRGDLDWIVMKCLEKDRARRYETANGLASDIQRHLNNEPVVACPPSNLYKFQKLIRRNKLAFAAGGGIATALVIGLTIALWQSVEKSRAYKQARTEAARSSQVAQFLKDMLQSVGPSVALGRDTTLLTEILVKTADRVDKDLKEQPLVQADLLSIIGRVYQELDEYGKAVEIHRRALEIRRNALGKEHADIASSLTDLGLAIQWENQGAEAEPLIREGLAMRRKLFGNEHLDVASSLSALANVFSVYNNNAKPAEAERLHREALALKRKLLGNENADIADSLEGISRALWQNGKLIEAERVMSEAHELRKKLFSEEHPTVAKTLRGLGNILAAQGRLEEAEMAFRQCLEITQKLHGAESWGFAVVRRNLGDILERQGRLSEAETAFRDAVAIFRRLAVRGGMNPQNRLSEALLSLARLLDREGKRTEAKGAFCEALPLFRQAADRGNANAQNWIGVYYANGHCVATNDVEADQWFRKSAEQGNQNGQANLGKGYVLGLGVQTNVAEGLKWLVRSADQGNTGAQRFLGDMYLNGIGVTANMAEALEWFRKAGERGDAGAQHNIGLMYLEGRGAEKNSTEGAAWLRKAAGQGNLDAQEQLARMYSIGQDVSRDEVEAANWYRKALARYRMNAEGGDPQSLNSAAWFLATCPLAEVRDGRSAVAFAEKAVAATNRKDPAILDTLAAAYAEAGDFAKATSVQKEAIALLQTEGEKQDYSSRLKLYESNTAYHERE